MHYVKKGNKNKFNSLEIISNNEEDNFQISSKYFTIKEFLNLDLNNNSLSLFHVNIVSRNKYFFFIFNFVFGDFRGVNKQITNFSLSRSTSQEL